MVAKLRLMMNERGSSTASSSGYVTLDILLRPRRVLHVFDADIPDLTGYTELDNGPELPVSLPVPLSLLGEPDLLAMYVNVCVVYHLGVGRDKREGISRGIARQVLDEVGGHEQGFNMGVEVEIVETEELHRPREEWGPLGQEFKARKPSGELMEAVKDRIESFLRMKLLGNWKGILGDTYTYAGTNWECRGIKRKRLEVTKCITGNY